MVICQICKNKGLSEFDNELICPCCGAAFGLEYIGMYDGGSNDRHDEGFEPDWWKQKYCNKVGQGEG